MTKHDEHTDLMRTIADLESARAELVRQKKDNEARLVEIRFELEETLPHWRYKAFAEERAKLVSANHLLDGQIVELTAQIRAEGVKIFEVNSERANERAERRAEKHAQLMEKIYQGFQILKKDLRSLRNAYLQLSDDTEADTSVRALASKVSEDLDELLRIAYEHSTIE